MPRRGLRPDKTRWKVLTREDRLGSKAVFIQRYVHGGSCLAKIHVQSVACSERRLCNRLVSDAPYYDGPPILHFLWHLDSYLVDVNWFAHRLVDRASENWAVVVLSHIRGRDRSVSRSALFSPDSTKLCPAYRRNRRTGNVHRKSNGYNLFAMDEIATGIRWR